MFIADQVNYWVESRPENLLYLSSSVNQPVAVLPGKSPEPTQAYIAIVYANKAYDLFIYLHGIHSNQGVLYRWDGGAVGKDQVPNIQREALGFTESMGFMMAEIRLRELAAPQKAEVYNNTPIFFQDLSRFKQQVEEEILEIEPADQVQELTVEPVEEPAETVTVGDFTIHEEAFAESSQAQPEMTLDELPDLEPIPAATPSPPAKPVQYVQAPSPPARPTQQVEPPPAPKPAPQVQQMPAPAPAQPEVSEEDLLLDSLEIKEEPAPAPVAPQVHAPKEEQNLIIEIDETPEPAEPPPQPVVAEEMRIDIEEPAAVAEAVLEPAPAAIITEPEPIAEPVQEEVVIDAQPEPAREEEVMISVEAEPEPAVSQVQEAVPEPEPMMEVEEVVMSAPAAEPVVEQEQVFTAPPAAPQPEPLPAPAPPPHPTPAPAVAHQEAELSVEQLMEETVEAEPPPHTVVETPEPIAAGHSPMEQEDLAMAVRFLVMF